MRFFHHFICLLLMILISNVAIGQPVYTNTNSTTRTITTPIRLFRIGFLEGREAGHAPEASLEILRRAMKADDDLMAEMRAQGYTDIGLLACDGPADMVRRLNSREFEVAFAPAKLYNEQFAGYTVVLKSRRPGDQSDARGTLVSRQGVVFASNRSPLFSEIDGEPDEVGNLVGSAPIAVVSTLSVAGFNAPLLELTELYGSDALRSGYVYFADSREVVKAVLAGLADVGACEESAVDEVLEEYGLLEQKDELLRTILLTRPVITDPVIMAPNLSPRISSLGRRVRASIQSLSLQGDLGQYTYLTSSDDEYRKLRELLNAFRTRVDGSNND